MCYLQHKQVTGSSEAQRTFQEKKDVLAVFFDLSNAFDKVWKEGLLVKLLRTSEQRGSQTHYMQTTWQSGMRLSTPPLTATYRIQEAISGINKWTLDWGLEINTSKTNSTLFSLCTSKNR